jgi:hypothetical protein
MYFFICPLYIINKPALSLIIGDFICMCSFLYFFFGILNPSILTCIFATRCRTFISTLLLRLIGFNRLIDIISLVDDEIIKNKALCTIKKMI